jgi:hypothetical protein
VFKILPSKNDQLRSLSRWWKNREEGKESEQDKGKEESENGGEEGRGATLCREANEGSENEQANACPEKQQSAYNKKEKEMKGENNTRKTTRRKDKKATRGNAQKITHQPESPQYPRPRQQRQY